MLCTLKRNIYIKDSVQMHFIKAHKNDIVFVCSICYTCFLKHVKQWIKFSLLSVMYISSVSKNYNSTSLKGF